jgi:hypothetical protein
LYKNTDRFSLKEDGFRAPGNRTPLSKYEIYKKINKYFC